MVRLARVKVEEDEEDEDPIVAEYPLVMTGLPQDKYLFHICFPTNKIEPYKGDTEIRFKRNVKLLEMRLKTDVSTGSFDRRKASRLPENLTKREDVVENVYVGQSNSEKIPVKNMIGVMKKGCIYLCPINDVFEMHHKTQHPEQIKKSKEDEDDTEEVESEGDSDSDTSDHPETLAAAPLRVRFTRAETKWQKKRREESSQHRKKIVEQDKWINLSLLQEPRSKPLSEFIDTTSSIVPAPSNFDIEELEKIISGKEKTTLNIEYGDSITYKKIKDVGDENIIRALIMKLEAASIEQIERLLPRPMKREEMLLHLRKSAHLVSNLWIMKSELMFEDETLKMARDLMLCLLNAKLPVRRSDLQKAFDLREGELDRMFNVLYLERGDNGWIIDEKKFSCDKAVNDLSIILEEKRNWSKRWEEIHKHIRNLKNKACKRKIDETQSPSGNVPIKRRAIRRVLIR